MDVADSRRHRRFTAAELDRMVRAGIVGEDEPLELLGGELLVMTPQTPEHAAMVARIRLCLERALGAGWHARSHSPLQAGPDSLPEPDIAVVRGEPEQYLAAHPTGSDALLVVEVAATSLASDRAKAGHYAKAGVPEYWLVDLAGRRLEVRTSPQADGSYASTQVLTDVDAASIPGTNATVPVRDLLA